MKILHSAAFLILSLFALHAFAGTFHVSPAGDDGADGSAGAPWATIGRGVRALRPGDTLVVTAGEYRESVAINGLRASAGKPVRIDGRAGAHLAAAGVDGILVTNSSWLEISGLSISGARGKAGIRIAGSKHITVQECSFSDNKRWCVKTALSDYVTVANCRIDAGASEQGVYFSTTDHPVLENCRIYGASGCGLHNNGDAGEGGDGVITGARFVGNTISGCGEAGGAAINMDGVEDSLIAENLVFDCSAGGIVSFHGDAARCGNANTFSGNAVYLPAGRGKYALKITGGCAGNTVKNNILVNGSDSHGALEMESATIEGLFSDGNIFFNLAGKPPVMFDDSFMPLTKWREMGFDAQSREMAPEEIFIDAAAGDFRLKPAAASAGPRRLNPMGESAGAVLPVNTGLTERGATVADERIVKVSTITFELPDPNEDVPRYTKQQNLEKARALLETAGERGSDIVCLPELFNTKRTADQREAEEIPGGETSRMLSEAAAKWKMYVLGCFYEKAGDKVYNSVALFGRDGAHVGTYHKVHLPPGECDYATPGDGFPVFETDFGKVGALVCIDIHFPEAARSLALQGADIIFCPTMYSEPRESITEILYRARAIENNVFMVCSNYAQKCLDPAAVHIGFGAIIDRYGEILANTGRREGVATAVVNLDEECPMAGIHKWDTRRPGAYRVLVEQQPRR